MINKTIFVLAIVAAFAAGTMVSGTAAQADKDDKPRNAKISLGDLFGLLMELETQIISLQTQVQLLSTTGGSSSNTELNSYTVAGHDPTGRAEAFCDTGDITMGGYAQTEDENGNEVPAHGGPITQNDGTTIGWKADPVFNGANSLAVVLCLDSAEPFR